MPLQFPARKIPQDEPDRIACALQDIRMAGTDFLVAGIDSTAITDVLRLREQLSNAIVELSAIESSLLDRADRLCQS